MIGQTLSHFRITAKLGEGGMGEVYRAEDSKLGREVAIKVLPEAVASDPERLARFEREAKVLASLNHPHIAAIYAIESATPSGQPEARLAPQDEGKATLGKPRDDQEPSAGRGMLPVEAGDRGAERQHPPVERSDQPARPIHFLVMELAEGEDLAERLARGPVPVEEALPIALQIAEAVEAAHERGVIHRDLKPANVKASSEGEIKVLDFGLAKALDSSADAGSGSLGASPVELSLSPTLTQQMTQAGVLLGTASYMSPEQARGQSVDKRSDIWAFGVILYELLTGRRLFGGETVTDVLAAIVRADLDLPALPTDTPHSIQRLIHRCLDRDPKTRLRDIGEVRIALAESVDNPEELRVADSPTAAGTGTRGWKAATGLLALGALSLGLLWLLDRNGGPPEGFESPHVRGMTLLTDLSGEQTAPSLSPDGNQLLYVSQDGGDKDIFLLRVGGQNAINLTAGSEGIDDHPAWSPDSQKIAFYSSRDGGGIFVMGATGESPLRVSDEGFHPAWSPDGTRLIYSDEYVQEVFSRGSTSALTVIELSSADKQKIEGTGDAVYGQWSPDGSIIAYWTADNGQRDIRTIVASGGTSYTSITDDAPADWSPVWSPDGQWLYFVSDRGGSPDLWRIAVDPATGEAAGSPESVTTGVADVMSASIAADGLDIAIGIEERSSTIERYAFDPESERLQGQAEAIFFSNNEVAQTDLTADGTWLAFRSTAPQDDLITMRVDGSSRRRLTNDMARDRGPNWSPDGEWLVFYSNREGSYDLHLIRQDGTGLRRLTGYSEADINDAFWSNDGSRIAALDMSVLETGIFAVDPAWLDPSTAIDPIQLGDRFPVIVSGDWSPDDRYLLAIQPSAGSVNQLGVLDTANGEFSPFNHPHGGAFEVWFDPAWLDNRRVVFWDRHLAAAFIAEIDTGQVREIPGVPGPSGFQVADEGRTLYLNRRILEADVWMLTLDSE